MSNGDLGWITNFIWNIADDILRDLYVRGKYRDVILPMTVLRRLDAVLEPTKQDVLTMKANLDKAGITNQDAALRQASGQAFYNTSTFTVVNARHRMLYGLHPSTISAEVGGTKRIPTNPKLEFRNCFAAAPPLARSPLASTAAPRRA